MSKNIKAILKRVKPYVRSLSHSLVITIIVLIIALFVGVFQNEQCAAAQQDAITIMPNDKMQALIDNIVSPTDQDKKMFSENGKKFLESKLAELKKMVSGDYEILIPQLLYYSAHAKDMKHAMAAGFIIEQLGISKRSIALSLIPYLDAKDAVLQKEMYNWLGGVDFDETTKTSNFSLYETIIREKKQAPPRGLIQYMYQRSPKKALQALTNIYTKESQVKESVIKANAIVEEDINKRYYGHLEDRYKVNVEAKKALDDLSKNNQWWVRLYATEIIGREPALRSPEILDRLKKDANPLVHDTLKRFQIEQEK